MSAQTADKLRAKPGARKVRVRKMYTHPADKMAANLSFCFDHGHALPCILIENLPPGLTAARVRKIVELTPEKLALAMFHKDFPTGSRWDWPCLFEGYKIQAENVLCYFGLTKPTARAKGRAK